MTLTPSGWEYGVRAAGTLTSVIDGRTGLRALFARLRRWRVGARWYAFALLPALLLTVSRLALCLISPRFVPAFFGSNHKASAFLLSLASGLMVGSFEEIGWTGFAVPRLRLRHAVITTGLVVGLVWGAWHFPLFWEADSFSAALPFTILLVRLFSWLPALRILMVWLHDRTESLPVVMLMHGSVSFVQILLPPGQLRGMALMAALLMTPAAMWILAAITLMIATRAPTGSSVSSPAGLSAPPRPSPAP